MIKITQNWFKFYSGHSINDYLLETGINPDLFNFSNKLDTNLTPQLKKSIEVGRLMVFRIKIPHGDSFPVLANYYGGQPLSDIITALAIANV